MAEPVLVVDLGQYSTKAALVAEGPVAVPLDPRTGSAWPACPVTGTGAGAVTSLLTAMRSAADRAARRDRPVAGSPDPAEERPVDRLTLVVPALHDHSVRDLLVAAGEAAGFATVELVTHVSAVVLDVRGPAPAPARPSEPVRDARPVPRPPRDPGRNDARSAPRGRGDPRSGPRGRADGGTTSRDTGRPDLTGRPEPAGRGADPRRPDSGIRPEWSDSNGRGGWGDRGARSPSGAFPQRSGEVALLGQDAMPAGPFLGTGDLVLVCDLGEQWSTALCQVSTEDVECLGRESSSAGRDLDAMLLDDLRTQMSGWMEPALSAPGEAGVRARREAMEFVRRVKHALADAGEVLDQLSPAVPPYRLTAEWLGRLAEPGLLWVAASSRTLLARATTSLTSSVPRGATLGDVAAVILVGGAARLPNAAAVIEAALGRPVVVPPDPGTAALRGAARWAAGAASRRIVADHPRWRVEPVSWSVPGGRARLERWTRAEATPYTRGTVLAQLRTPDEQVYDLTAPEDGVLLAQPVRVGDPVGPTLVAAAKRQASCLAGDPPDKRQEFSATGEWLLTPDRRLLVECAASARYVKLWSIPDGRLVSEFVPTLDSAEPRFGRVFVSPEGRLSLVAWDQAGLFSVWDVRAGRRLTVFRDTHAPYNVRVNEVQWRLTAEGEDGTAGRYRRPIATIWDLATGARVERLTDDLQRRLAGYRLRSAVDGFGERAVSPDGRLQAVGVRTPRGATALALQESTSDLEVFRAEHEPAAHVRMAFTADGRFLLANWESDQNSQVEVWEL